MSWFVDAVLAILVVEAVVLAIVLARRPRGPRFLALLPNLLAGLFLLLAVRAGLAGATVPLLGCLACAGLAHVADLLTRFRG